ncbi:MAG: preprotein translocase subunit SecY [Candidatus Diapherotrites archaeon]|nr:preprotein translocase subunit SecY [Candidatus Diapherotrites archaeon]
MSLNALGSIFGAAIQSVINVLPEVRSPKTKPVFKKRIMWTLLALVIFFVMGEIALVGMSSSSEQSFAQLQLILASKIGTLVTVGIGPIVLASIFLQLLVGSEIIKVDLSNPADKAIFMGWQKILAILLSFFEAAIYVMTGFISPIEGLFLGFMPFSIFLALQIAFGSILLMYLDEVVSKYGMGSGISIFIAGGVMGAVAVRTFSFFGTGVEGEVAGLLPNFILQLIQGTPVFVSLLPIFFMIIVFLMVVYAEGMHVDVPITTVRARGFGGRYPLKFLYVSNIPVILASALFANVMLWGHLIWDFAGKEVNLITQIFGVFNSGGQAIGGLAYYVSAPYGALGTPTDVVMLLSRPDMILHIIVYALIMIFTCMVFGRLWIEMAGQGSRNVAQQIQGAGLQIPGFRRDPRVIERVLNKYIPQITILGSAFVGLLAAFADLTGALGTGTGILLTVGIVYRLYEEIAQEQLTESHPLIAKFMGGGKK